MSEMNLICNYKKCRVVLNALAWVTSCSHIFCDNDGNRTFNREKKCPCCNEVLNRRLDIVQINLNPDESFKSVCISIQNNCFLKFFFFLMVKNAVIFTYIFAFFKMILCGLRPDVVMDISLRAVSFWNYQMTQEKIIQTTNIKRLQAKFEQVNINVETMKRQFKKHLLIESKKCESKFTFKEF